MGSIFLDFAEETTQKWEKHDFDYAKWLRDIKKVKIEQSLDQKKLKKEYHNYSISHYRMDQCWPRVARRWLCSLNERYLKDNFWRILQLDNKLLREQHQTFLAERRGQKKVTEISTNWKNIHPDFTPELQKKWEGQGFDYQTTEAWIDIGLTVQDSAYGAWLRNIKNLSAEKAPREEYNNDLVATQQWLDKR